MRHDLHSNNPPAGFERITLADNQTTKCPTLLENGLYLETRDNAGPGVFDYQNVLHMDDLGGDAMREWVVGNREITWVLCDGRLMGQNNADTFPIGSDNLNQFIEWEDCNYAVFTDLEWEIIMMVPEPRDIATYRSQVIEPVDTAAPGKDFTWMAPSESTDLEEWMDAKVTGAYELEGGDVWWRRSESMVAPYALTVMRVPISEAQEETVLDMFWNEDQDQERFMLDFAPVGMLICDGITDVPEFVGNGAAAEHHSLGNPTMNRPECWLEGTTLWAPGGTTEIMSMRDRQFRAWEPYDELEPGIILHREMHSMQLKVPPNDNVQEVAAIDVDNPTEGFESTGLMAFPRMGTGRSYYRFKGSLEGPIIVSARDPRPLIINLSGLPVRLDANLDAGGGGFDRYHRPPTIVIRNRITANVKIR